MQPIHELLNRIRWDQEFSSGRFDIGYHDRVEGRIVRVPLFDVVFPEGENAFELVDEDGQSHRIPFHRVREVYKNGQLIWKRPPMPSHE
jgi:uncharacterized protein (UPF0248 family)